MKSAAVKKRGVKIGGAPFTVVDWKEVHPTTHPGTEGVASWRTVDVGNIRVRVVEYSPGYVADHWCSKGHVVLVLEGELTTELKDGRKFVTAAGSGFHVEESEKNPHTSRTEKGAKLYIVD